jgi:rod shape-determining protein MreD
VLRTILCTTGLIVLCNLAQSTWFHAIEVFGVIPDLGLLVLIYVSFANISSEGQISGFLSGIIQDFISAAPLGLSAFVKTLIATVYSFIAGNFYVDKIFLPMIFGATSTLLKAIAVTIIALIFPEHVHPYSFTDRVIWIEIAYNTVLAPIIFLLLGLARPILVTARNRE